MAKKSYGNTNARSQEDRALDTFAELMIDKINSLQSDWKKPWFTPTSAQLPQNFDGRYYNGMNSIILMLQQEKNGWNTSRYATFDRFYALNFKEDKTGAKVPVLDKNGNRLPIVSVMTGEKSTPVMIPVFTVVNNETRKKINYDDYRKMSEEERAKYRVFPKLVVYKVFNVDQTNLSQTRPELYQKFIDEHNSVINRDDKDMASLPSIDAMIDKNLWVCPIKPIFGDNAYYNPYEDYIVVPEKKQFMDGEAFYTNLFHEMTHSTGADNRLHREIRNDFGSEKYAREELVAELSAALISSHYGMEKHVKEDSAAYLKSWLSALQADPSFIKSTLFDVKRASSFITDRINAVQECLDRDGESATFAEVRDMNKQFSKMFSADLMADNTHPDPEMESQDKEKGKEEAVIAARGLDPHRFHR